MDTTVAKAYCLRCKKVTNSIDLEERISKNNKLMLHSKCVECGANKCLILGKKRTGKGIVNKLLNSGKLPEMHLPSHKFTGPGTKLKERLLRGDEPVNKLDAAAMLHDMSYEMFKDTKDRHVFDKKLQKEAFKIAKDPSSSLREKTEAGLVGSIMYGKRKMGMGDKLDV